MSTPGTGGLPPRAFPAPPGPVVGEIPPCASGSAPCASPVFPAPAPAPFNPLPVPSPRPILDPPPAPPSPGFSPPAGDIDMAPLAPEDGSPTVDPGWLDITTAALLPLPPAVGGATGAPTSSGAPRPAPFRPRPEPDVPAPPATEGGGGTTLFASKV